MQKNQEFYTKEQVEIELIKQNNSYIIKTLDRIESQQKWLIGVMTSGFVGLLGLIAHGFKWLI